MQREQLRAIPPTVLHLTLSNVIPLSQILAYVKRIHHLQTVYNYLTCKPPFDQKDCDEPQNTLRINGTVTIIKNYTQWFPLNKEITSNRLFFLFFFPWGKTKNSDHHELNTYSRSIYEKFTIFFCIRTLNI